MRIERVVVDASPLIILFKSGLAGLLPQLFTEIVVPATVRDEVMASGKNDPAVIGLADAAWATAVDETRQYRPSSPLGIWTRRVERAGASAAHERCTCSARRPGGTQLRQGLADSHAGNGRRDPAGEAARLDQFSRCGANKNPGCWLLAIGGLASNCVGLGGRGLTLQAGK